MNTFTTYKLKNTEFKNRLVMPPMCMYSADDSGMPNDFHFVHYETRAMGGVGLIIVEATGVTPDGRISDEDLGIWEDTHIKAHSKIVKGIEKHNVVPGIQLAHAGRKRVGMSSNPVAPSPIAFDETSRVPHELNQEEISGIVRAFKEGALRALQAGYKLIEIHGAHGYLIHEFLSPISNHRQDAYGGSLKNRVRMLNEVIDAVASIIPEDVILGLRISASDYMEGGIDCDEMVKIINLVKEKIDIVHVSSGGMQNVPMKVYPGYQLSFSEQIKKECGVDTIGVGLITTIEEMDHAIEQGRCDMIAIGRLLLRNPYFPIQEGTKKGITDYIPKPYHRGFY